MPIPWVRNDAATVPAHWRGFASRASPITGNSRLAGNPANAVLSSLYSILEAEARLACLAAGLDPGLGVLHSDLSTRTATSRSLVYPLQEEHRTRVRAFDRDLWRAAVTRAVPYRAVLVADGRDSRAW